MSYFDLRCGHVLSLLHLMPDDSVNCVVTSPPYWGLRDYGTEPQVWGGLASCQHEWGVRHTIRDIREETTTAKSRTTDRFYGDESRRFNGNHQKILDGQFCQLCGAWYGSLGQEPGLWLYIDHLTSVFTEVRRVLRSDGVCWLNLGDCYANDGKWGGETGGKQSYLDDNDQKRVGRGKRVTGLKPKDLCMLPHRCAISLQDDGWWVRNDIVWHKRNPLPESVGDRCTRAHEFIFHLTKSKDYWFDGEAIKEPCGGFNGSSFTKGKTSEARRHLAAIGTGDRVESTERNKRSVWSMSTLPTPEAHFATFPIDLAETCILAGCPEGGVVLDPFNGAATTGLAALKHGRRYIGLELNPDYIAISRERARKYYPLLVGSEGDAA